jgi:CRP-like cAMP-binding protein
MDGFHTRRISTRSPDPMKGIPAGNLLLAALPQETYRQLVVRCKAVELTIGEVLCQQGEPMSNVYFPTDGFISLICSLDERSRLEAALIGVEGMLGASLVLGVNIAHGRATVRGRGSALRLNAVQFARQLKESPALEQTLKHYLHLVTRQFVQIAACSQFHFIEARLARWLLMARDRSRSNEFHLTQDDIAYMLGVRRVSVTTAANALRKRNLIHYYRGTVTILDRRGLETASCQCYGADCWSRGVTRAVTGRA